MTMTTKPRSTELDILIKLLKMTTSSHDTEALSAMRLANKQILKLGTDWEDLLLSKVTLVADPFTSIPDIAPTTPDMPAHRQPTRVPPQPPPRPAPPVYFSNAIEIQGYFDALEFVTLTPYLQKQIDQVEANWRTYNRLDSNDYQFLAREARVHATKPTKTRQRRRRSP